MREDQGARREEGGSYLPISVFDPEPFKIFPREE
jgi:hypothetical protein